MCASEWYSMYMLNLHVGLQLDLLNSRPADSVRMSQFVYFAQHKCHINIVYEDISNSVEDSYLVQAWVRLLLLLFFTCIFLFRATRTSA